MSVKTIFMSALITTNVLLSVPSQAHEKGDFILRAGIANVSPSEISGIIQPTVVSQNGKVSSA